MKFIAVGDSIAAGIGDVPIDGRLAAWSGRLAAWCEGTHVNLAVPGARIGMVHRLQVPAAVQAKAAVVLMSVGGNDVVDRRFDPVRFSEGLGRGLTLLDAAGCRTVLITVADWSQAWPMPARLRRGFGRRIKQVNEVIRTHAQARDALVIERAHDDPLRDRDCLHPDRVHLSPLGYRRLALITADLLGLRPAPEGDEPGPAVEQKKLRASHLRPLLRRTPDLTRLMFAEPGGQASISWRRPPSGAD